MSNTVGVGILGHKAYFEAAQDLEDATVRSGLSLHVLIKYLNGKHTFGTGNNLDLWLFAHIIASDQSAGMFRLKSVHHSQRNF